MKRNTADKNMASSNVNKCKKNNILQIVIMILSCFLILIMQEVGMAFLPIFALELMGIFLSKTCSLLTVYNNIFIGFVTLSVGNLIYLHYECGKNNQEIKNILFTLSLVAFFISLIAFVATSLDAIGVIKLDTNIYYFYVSIFLGIFIVLVDALKFVNSIRRKLNVD